MRAIIILLFICPLLCGQQPTLVRKIIPGWEAKALARSPARVLNLGERGSVFVQGGDVITKVTKDTAVYRTPEDETYVILQENLGFRDRNTGQYKVSRPELWQGSNGYYVDQTEVNTTLQTDQGISTVAVIEEGVGFSFDFPELTLMEGVDGFTFETGAPDSLLVRLQGRGFAFRTEPIATVGTAADVYSFPYIEYGLRLTVEAEGWISAGEQYQISRAAMVGASGRKYECSSWALDGETASFSCDSRTLPTDEFPYFVDPTVTIYGDDPDDDGKVWGVGETCPPLATFYSRTVAQTDLRVSQRASDCVYEVGLTLFETSGITGITEAAHGIYYTTSIPDTDGCNFQGEYYAASNWPIDTSDYTIDVGSDAFQTTLSAITPGQYTEHPLSNLSNINPSGQTGFRFGPNCGGVPTGENRAQVQFSEGANPPYLKITYGPTGSSLMRIINSP